MFSCGFYNSLNGDRKYSAIQFGEMFDGLIVDGIYATIGEAFGVEPGGGMNVTVGTGRAWFNKTWSVNDAKLPLAIEMADLLLPRIDVVVLEVDTRTAVRDNCIKVITGSPAVTPAKPTLMNADGLYQYALAYIDVPANLESIAKSNIDNQMGRGSTPFVTGVLQSISIDDAWMQWEGQFDEWFAGIKSQLSGDIAANLQRQVEELKDGKVNVSDKATEEDIVAGTAGKWIDAEIYKGKVDKTPNAFYDLMNPGDMILSTLNPNSRLGRSDFQPMDGRAVSLSQYPWIGTSEYFTHKLPDITEIKNPTVEEHSEFRKADLAYSIEYNGIIMYVYNRSDDAHYGVSMYASGKFYDSALPVNTNSYGQNGYIVDFIEYGGYAYLIYMVHPNTARDRMIIVKYDFSIPSGSTKTYLDYVELLMPKYKQVNTSSDDAQFYPQSVYRQNSNSSYRKYLFVAFGVGKLYAASGSGYKSAGCIIRIDLSAMTYLDLTPTTTSGSELVPNGLISSFLGESPSAYALPFVSSSSIGYGCICELTSSTLAVAISLCPGSSANPVTHYVNYYYVTSAYSSSPVAYYRKNYSIGTRGIGGVFFMCFASSKLMMLSYSNDGDSSTTTVTKPYITLATCSNYSAASPTFTTKSIILDNTNANGAWTLVGISRYLYNSILYLDISLSNGTLKKHIYATLDTSTATLTETSDYGGKTLTYPKIYGLYEPTVRISYKLAPYDVETREIPYKNKNSGYNMVVYNPSATMLTPYPIPTDRSWKNTFGKVYEIDDYIYIMGGSAFYRLDTGRRVLEPKKEDVYVKLK